MKVKNRELKVWGEDRRGVRRFKPTMMMGCHIFLWFIKLERDYEEKIKWRRLRFSNLNMFLTLININYFGFSSSFFFLNN